MLGFDSYRRGQKCDLPAFMYNNIEFVLHYIVIHAFERIHYLASIFSNPEQ